MQQVKQIDPSLAAQINSGKAYREGLDAGWAWTQNMKKEPPKNPYPPGTLNDKWESGYIEALDDWHHAQYTD